MNTSFSSETKNELARIVIGDKCCQAAELSALLRFNGRLELTRNKRKTLCITTDNAGTARKAFKLFKSLSEFPLTVIMETKKRFNTNRFYMVRAQLDIENAAVLKKLGLIDQEKGLVFGVAPEMVKSRCCKRAYLRGAFLARGSVSRPGGSYHLEITCPSYELAESVQKLSDGLGINFRIIERKSRAVLYLKDSEQIADCMRIMGANYALLEFENIRAFKSMKNQVNRQVNCETANLEKTLNASIRQVEVIQQLIDKIAVQGIPEQLRELALLRLDYPDATLRELGEMMNPSLSKSGVAYRMRKIEKLGERL